MSEFWDEQTVIGEVERDERNKIVVSRTRLKDKQYVDIRTWYQNRSNDGQWLPGKGISVPVEQFDKVMALLEQIKQSDKSTRTR
ncbi:MAG: transcriptional coactivator p15/PC4 family protein [Bacilli bacterium]